MKLFINQITLSALTIGLLPLVIPRRFLIDYFLWLLIPTIFIFTYIFQTPIADQDEGIIFVVLILTIATALIFFPAALRIAYILFKERGPPKSSLFGKSSILRGALGFIYGALTLYLLFILLQPYLVEVLPPASLHLAAALIVTTLIFESRKKIRLKKNSSGHFMAGAASALAILTALSLVTPYFIMKSARSVAGKSPYCIVIADSRYSDKPDETLFDMTGFVTLVPRIGSRHCTVLAVKNDNAIDLYHWSYGSKKFILTNLNQSSEKSGRFIGCMPQKNFLNTLNIWHGKKTAELKIAMQDGAAYKIPLTYRPETGYESKSATIYTKVPDFLPLENIDHVLNAKDARSFYSVSMSVKPREWLARFWRDAQPVTQNRHLQYDLQVWAESYGTTYYKQGENGWIDTYIRCADGREKDFACQHEFYRDGLSYSFNHGREDLENWKEMQDKLVSLLPSWKYIPE